MDLKNSPMFYRNNNLIITTFGENYFNQYYTDQTLVQVNDTHNRG